MNILFLSLLYHPDAVETVSRLSRVGLQNQINNFQWAVIQGLEQNLQAGERLTVVNALPVGIYPFQYRKLVLRGHRRDDSFIETGCVNLPWLKQRARARQAEREMERWIDASPENRTILVYTLYLPYLRAVQAVRRRHADVRTAVIVTDLPNDRGIASGRKGLFKKLEHSMGERQLALCGAFDGFVLLTGYMAEALPIAARPRLIMEGIVSELEPPEAATGVPDDPRPAVLYTGTLNRELGIGLLLDAFRNHTDAQLWLCGRGDMENEVRDAAANHPAIRYFGFVPQKQALALQARAAVLINPRTSDGLYTRYSFPSKTLEYMRSGKPVLCCKLEGIPDEYDAFLYYIQPQTADGIIRAVGDLLALLPEERERMGERAREFALTHKNSRAQGKRIYDFLGQLLTLPNRQP